MKDTTPPSEHSESRILIEHALEMARQLNISKLIVHANQKLDRKIIEKCRGDAKVIWLTRTAKPFAVRARSRNMRIALPEAPISRNQQVSLGLFISVVRGFLGLDESVLCLTSAIGSERVDSLVIANPRRDAPWLAEKSLRGARGRMATNEFARLLQIALQFAREGREGRDIGTVFVLGDVRALRPYVRQLVLNPCAGHSRSLRNIHNSEFLESLRELTALDGAFIVNTRGVVESAGTYLNVSGKAQGLRPGWGARHTAAALITARTKSVAIAISQSSDNVTVFLGGRAILEMEQGTEG